MSSYADDTFNTSLEPVVLSIQSDEAGRVCRSQDWMYGRNFRQSVRGAV